MGSSVSAQEEFRKRQRGKERVYLYRTLVRDPMEQAREYCPQELSGLYFYNQRESGKVEKTTFFLIL